MRMNGEAFGGVMLSKIVKIVPTLRGKASMDALRPLERLCAERHELHSHAERGNDQVLRGTGIKPGFC